MVNENIWKQRTGLSDAYSTQGTSPFINNFRFWLKQPLGRQCVMTVVAEMLEQAPRDGALLSLTEDGAYDTQSVYEARLGRRAIPIIPSRQNARIRNAAIAAYRRWGRRIWKVWSGYHRRSLVETKMNCIKRLGGRLMSITFERQVNELHIRAAILNQFTELCCPQTVAVA